MMIILGLPLLLVVVRVTATSASGEDVGASDSPPEGLLESASASLLHYNFPSEADTLAYVDALKHSDLSEWRSLEEVAARAGGGSCSGAVTTSVLTALYLLGLFNLCAASPVSCCIPPVTTRKRRSISKNIKVEKEPILHPILNGLQKNLSSMSLEQFRDLPHVSTPDGGRVPVHVSVVEQVRKLWDSNPRLLSSVTCNSATESVRSSFISLSGVASGIILAYSVAQLSQCYPDVSNSGGQPPKIWFFDIPKPPPNYSPPQKEFPIPSLPGTIPVQGDNEDEDGCERMEVPLEGGRCAPLLSPTHCPYHHWVLLNRKTMKGECVPRLCGEGRVYVEKDQMCHHIDEVGLCPRNQRLYVTATGHAVCDCPDGMFQGPYGNCYHLYERAYCSNDLILMINKESQSLSCQNDPCGHVNANLWQDDLPYAPSSDGFCYQFNNDKPCGKGKRFGFDAVKLEAGCVSLVDAGLVRPRRSYMYHHMSFPSSHDEEFPHYQVSYVILNGTTWGLEIKGVGDDKKNSTSRSRRSPEQKVEFIDTRDIPKKLENILLPKVNTKIKRTYNFKDSKRKQVSAGRSIIKVKQNNRPPRLRKSKNYSYFQSKVSVVKSDSNDKQSKPENKVDILSSDQRKEKENTTKIINVKLQNNNNIGSSKDTITSNRKNYLDTKIRGIKGAIKKVDQESETKPQSFIKSKNSKSKTDKINATGDTAISKSKNNQNNTDARIIKSISTALNKTKDVNNKTTLTKLEHQKILREAIKEEMERILQKKQLRNTVRKAIQSQLVTSKEVNNTNETKSEEVIVVHQSSNEKLNHKKSSQPRQSIVNVNQKQTSQPNTLPSKNKKAKPPQRKIINNKRKINVSQKPRRRTGKELRRGKRKKFHKKRGRRKKKRGHSKFSHRHKHKKKKRKNPSLPIKVATTTPASSTTIKSTTTISVTNATKTPKLVIKNKIKEKQDKMNKLIGRESSKNQILNPNNEDKVASEENSSLDSEFSLPDYLRHRGRRQLGGGGGIIQAPLLSACKPGAKRDYNYKCRPKFIPQDRNRRESDDPAYDKETSPSTPRIKCPKGTRLNPRGQCQATSSILG